MSLPLATGTAWTGNFCLKSVSLKLHFFYIFFFFLQLDDIFELHFFVCFWVNQATAHSVGVRKAIKQTKNRLVMEFFRKGRGGLGPIHNFVAHFGASKVMEFFDENRGLWVLFLKCLY